MPFVSKAQRRFFYSQLPHLAKKWERHTPKGKKLPEKKQQGGFSQLGYKQNSPDVNNPFNIIPSGNITMKDVNFPVLGMDELGNQKIMKPGRNYKFPGNQVFEIPLKQQGGRLVSEVPQGYIPLQGKPNYWHNPQSSQSTASGAKMSNQEWSNFLNSPQGIAYKQKQSQNSDDIVYTQPSIQPSNEPSTSLRGQPVYRANKHIAGEIFYPTRSSTNLADAGTLNTANQNAKLRFRNDFGFTGEEASLTSDEVQKYLGTSHTFGNDNLYNELRTRPLTNPLTLKRKGGIVKKQLGGPNEYEPLIGGNLQLTGENLNSSQWEQPISPIVNTQGIITQGAVQQSIAPEPLKEKRDMSYYPFFANSVAQALATRVDNRRREDKNMVSPFNVIPETNNTNEYVNYGTNVYQEGGEIEEEEDDEDLMFEEDFMFDDEEEIEQEEFIEDEQVIEDTPDEMIQQDEEEQSVIDLDGDGSEDFDEDSDEGGSTGLPINITRNSNGTVNPMSLKDKPVAISNLKARATKNEDEAYNYLVSSKGLSPHVAAGIIGNLIQESGLKTGAVEAGGTRNGRGIAQWDVRNRWKDLLNWANKNGKDPYELHTQLDYLVVEADKRGDLNKVNTAKDAAKAAYLFANHFERPKVIEDVRMRNAERIYKKFNN